MYLFIHYTLVEKVQKRDGLNRRKIESSTEGWNGRRHGLFNQIAGHPSRGGSMIGPGCRLTGDPLIQVHEK